ncbi:MAG: dihydrolipoamide acetyltransferase family protein, partial [Pseudomonadota bacterium]
MAVHIIRLPDIGEGVTEAEIVDWHVQAGDIIEEEQNLVDVMTDKATVETPSPVEGVVKTIHGEVGDIVAVGSVLVEIDIDGEASATLADEDNPEVHHTSIPAPLEETPVSSQRADTAPAPASSDNASPLSRHPSPAQRRDAIAQQTASESVQHSDPFAAPATRSRAYALGIPLQFVPGTGPGGRITPADLDRYIAGDTVDARSTGAHASSPLQKRSGVKEIKVIGLRRKIAERMQDAKSRIPHFSYIEEFDLTALERLRRDLNEDRTTDQPKLTLLPFFMRAIVLLQPEFPQINAVYDDDANVLRAHEGVHIGIATQTDGGLMVPVVKHTESRDLWDCARELRRVTAAAREGSAGLNELTGSTITLTSLGTLGGIAATPVINSPEVAIIGPNKLVERPVIHNGEIIIRT